MRSMVPQIAILGPRLLRLFQGDAVEFRYAAGLRDAAGNHAHAAAFIRLRVVLLDRDLKRDPRERRRIVLHELFHFVWVRLSNERRWSWEALLRNEWKARNRGEAGWSAEWRKRALSADDIVRRTRRWREYSCESFCDTGTWLIGPESAEVTLPKTRLQVRRLWFEAQFGSLDGVRFPI